MMNEESIRAVGESGFSSCFRKPLYDSFCFSQIPETLCSLFSGRQEGLPPSCFQKGPYDQVIFIFLDAFGWKFFERHQSHPFLARFKEKGIVSKITSQFPSTTAAHVTTIHTGLQVGQSGIHEWFAYEPLVDRMIAPLLFSYAGDEGSDSLISSGYSPHLFFPFDTIYQRMKEEGVDSYVIQEAGITESPYSQVLCKGSHPVSFLNFSQGLKNIQEIVSGPKDNKRYVFFYHAAIDAIMHREGVDSLASGRTITYYLDLLEKELMPVFQNLKNTALVLSADHGMASVFPKKTIYINLELPEITEWIKKNKDGALLVPAGSCRDFFLHIQDEFLETAFSSISRFLLGRAEVWRVSDLIDLGFFGQVSSRFLERVGNLVILPYEGEGVWWFENHKFRQNFHGAHGGLTPNEMDTIFLFLDSN
jgi:hypothetical protein